MASKRFAKGALECDSDSSYGDQLDQSVPFAGHVKLTSDLDMHASKLSDSSFYNTKPMAQLKSDGSRLLCDDKDLLRNESLITADSGIDSGMDKYSFESNLSTNLRSESFTARGCMPETSEMFEQKFKNLSLDNEHSDRCDSAFESGIHTMPSLPEPCEIPDDSSPKEPASDYGTSFARIPGLEMLSWDHPQFWPSYFHSDDEGDTDLHISIIHQKPEVLQLIETAVAASCLNIQNYEYLQTPLHLAVLTHQPFVARKLLCWGATLDVRNQRGDTPLHIACRNGSFDCVTGLTVPLLCAEVKNIPYDLPLQAIPQDPELVNYEGESCLHLAALGQHEEIFMYLVKNCNADINKQETKAGRTVLHRAVLCNDIAWVQTLLSIRGIDLEALTFSGKTALDIALDCGFEEIASLLQAHGAELDDMDTEDYSDEEPIADLPYDDMSINGRPLLTEIAR
nr:NF-kappa-B inhibitor alpha-like protein [Arenicola marina]